MDEPAIERAIFNLPGHSRLFVWDWWPSTCFSPGDREDPCRTLSAYIASFDANEQSDLVAVAGPDDRASIHTIRDRLAQLAKKQFPPFASICLPGWK